MNIFLLILIGLVAGVVSAMLGWPIWVLWIVLSVILFIQIGNMLVTLFKTRNLQKIHKFLVKNKKEPIYAFMLAHAENDDVKKRRALEEVLAKHSAPKYRATYGVYLALLNEDFEAAKKAIQPFLNTDTGDYTNELIHIMAGETYSSKRTYKKQWMNDSIVAHEAYMRKDLQAFDEFAQKSLNATGGIQYFGNYYSFDQMRMKLANTL